MLSITHKIIKGLYTTTAEDLGFAVHFKAGSSWSYAQLSYLKIVEWYNSIHPKCCSVVY